MGRRFPMGENVAINPVLSLSLLIACVSSIIAIISLLCGSFSRKKESSPPHRDSNGKDCGDVFSPQNEVTKTLGHSSGTEHPFVTSSPTDQNKETHDVSTSITSHNSCHKPLLPPLLTNKKHSRASSYHFHKNSRGSIEKLTSSMSVRGIRQMSRRDSEKSSQKYFKHEDPIWKKQIILGEKCRVPDEDDTIICDEKGNKISTFHPKKTVSALTLSRQSSITGSNAIPS